MNGSLKNIAKRVETLKEAADRECIDTPHAGLALIVRDLAAEVEVLVKLVHEREG